MHFQLTAHIADGVGVRGFEGLAILGDDGGVQIDQLLGRAISLGVFISAFACDFALMPSAKREFRQPGHEEEERDASERNQEKRGEHAGNIELEAGLQDFIGKA